MYSESDVDDAVAAGALSANAAARLRGHVAARRGAPAVDEEQFRLLTGFNDIFVAIAIALLLAAVAGLGRIVAAGLAGAAVAGTAWLLAEYFTARRRMALPSILLLLAFVGGIAAAGVGTLIDIRTELSGRGGALAASGVAALTAGAAWLHWRRFQVPITVAAGAVAVVAVLAGLVDAAAPELDEAIWALALVAGIAVFALAIRWDLSDRERRTKRSDVAFWLHLAAAPLIAHSVFRLLGVLGGEVGVGSALLVLALYVLFAAVALAVDRRALLVSGLAYVLYALIALFRSAGALELSWAFTALVIGSALLTLSAFWQPMRRAVVTRLGGLGHRLPPVATA